MSGANISSKLRKLTLCRDELDDEAGDEEQSQHLCHWIRNVSLGHWRLSFFVENWQQQTICKEHTVLVTWLLGCRNTQIWGDTIDNSTTRCPVTDWLLYYSDSHAKDTRQVLQFHWLFSYRSPRKKHLAIFQSPKSPHALQAPPTCSEKKWPLLSDAIRVSTRPVTGAATSWTTHRTLFFSNV